MDNEIEDAAVNLLFAEEEEQLLARIVEFLDNLNPNIVTLASSTFQTLEMVFFSTLIAFIIGFPIGIMLNSTSKYGITPRPVLNLVVSRIIDVLRSFPFVILMIVLLPFTRLVLKTAIGTAATIIPLSIAAAPFVARITESALAEVDSGMVLAARAMGSTNSQIIFKVLIPEAMPSVISGLTLTIINLVSYSAMAGTLGGGGLGDLAIRYGYQRFQTDIMVDAVIVIIVIVALVQFLGTRLCNKMLSKR